MRSHPGHNIASVAPPDGATCDTHGCLAAASVRIIIPNSQFEADGIDHKRNLATVDACEWHWPGVRDTWHHNGYQVVDTTGELGQLAAEFPDWTIFYSDGGRLYASARVKGSDQGTTLHAYLIGQLREQICAAEAPWPPH